MQSCCQLSGLCFGLAPLRLQAASFRWVLRIQRVPVGLLVGAQVFLQLHQLRVIAGQLLRLLELLGHCRFGLLALFGQGLGLVGVVLLAQVTRLQLGQRRFDCLTTGGRPLDHHIVSRGRWGLSGVVQTAAGPDTAPPDSPWTNGQSLKAWVRVYQTGGVSKTAASAAFTVSWTPPATPTLTVTAGSPVQVVVSGVTVGNVVQIEQALDGVTWTPLTSRTATATTMTVTSVLAANGTAVKLRARQGSIVEGVPMTSAWSAQQTVTATPDGCWLVDDADRATALKVSPVTDTRRGIVQGITATYGLGATRARVDSTPQAGERGELVLATDTLAERAALLAWLKDRSVWWIAMCPDDGQPHRPIRAARVSPPEWERLAQTALSSIYHLPVSWVEQA